MNAIESDLTTRIIVIQNTIAKQIEAGRIKKTGEVT